MKIRKATKGDYEKVIELYADFVNQPDRYKNLDNDSFLKTLEIPNSHIYLAETENKIVGFIAFSERTVIRYPKPIVEVEEFYVVPDLRRQGIGKRLMEKAIALAQKNNCQYIFLASSKDRVPAHKFYKALGFDEYAFHYRRKP
ncbi:MAG: GNAT family N-acetyltransferase [bacterium]|nr:GNAT family N-acetyltransferase [bacterium]